MTMWKWISRQMRQYPDQTVGEGADSLTYAELIRESEARAKSPLPSKIGICCRSEWNTARAMLCCLAAEKTAVPLSARYGELHCRHIVETMELSHLFTDEGGELQLRCIDEDRPDSEPENLTSVAVILCTSGTTGLPKGAMLTDEGLIANLTAIGEYFPLNGNDRILIARPLYHCAVLVGEFLISLIKGVRIRFYGGTFNPSALVNRLNEEQASVFCGTPTLFHHLSHFAGRGGGVPSLRMAAISGECLTPAVADKLQSAFPQTDFYHVYGLTEAGPRACWLPPDEFHAHSQSAGYPLTGVCAQVVDEQGKSLPPGTDGELVLRTPAAMRGYYRQPDATAHVFRGGWLHTGDVARMDEAGRVTILSRLDDMIIRGGINIYPQEIEDILCAIEGVREAAACGERDELVGQKIRVRVVAPGMSAAALSRACRDRLPPHQWPDILELTDSLPRNGSGKVIRKGGKTG